MYYAASTCFIILVARLALPSSRGIIRSTVRAAIVAASAFCLRFSTAALVLGAVLLAIEIAQFTVHRTSTTGSGSRNTFRLMADFAAFALQLSAAVVAAHFAAGIQSLVAIAHSFFFSVTGLYADKTLLAVSGLAYLWREANNPILFTLKTFDLIPAPPVGRSTTKATKAHAAYRGVEAEVRIGKLIGVLERSLMYVLVATGNLASIAFILAAKGFTRYREMENKRFAEYVLVGTFLSSASAVAVGLAVKSLVQ